MKDYCLVPFFLHYRIVKGIIHPKKKQNKKTSLRCINSKCLCFHIIKVNGDRECGSDEYYLRLSSTESHAALNVMRGSK